MNARARLLVAATLVTLLTSLGPLPVLQGTGAAAVPSSEARPDRDPSQAAGRTRPPVQERLKELLFGHHRDALLVRQLDVLERWQRASPERRQQVAEAAQRFLPQTRGSGRQARPQELVLLAALLEGQSLEDARADELFALARALDLRVQPGTLHVDAAAEGETMPGAREEALASESGPPLTVQATLLFPCAFVGRLTIELFWIAPDGRRLLARSEPFSAKALRIPGVPLYVRAPLEMVWSAAGDGSAQGLWFLQPEIVVGDRRVVGLAVPVPVIDRFDGRALEQLGPERIEEETLRRTFGVRSLRPIVGRKVGHASDARERPAWEDAFVGLDAHVIATPPALEEVAEDATAPRQPWFVLVAPHGEPAELLACGTPGEALARWAQETGCGILSLAVGRDDRTRFLEALVALRATHPRAEVYVVGRGDAAVQLAMWASSGAREAAEPWEMDGLVLCAERAPLATRWRGLSVWVISQEEPSFLSGSRDEGDGADERLVWKQSPWPSAWFHDADLVSELRWVLATR